MLKETRRTASPYFFFVLFSAESAVVDLTKPAFFIGDTERDVAAEVDAEVAGEVVAEVAVEVAADAAASVDNKLLRGSDR
jgi:hypothetical protein